MDVDSNLQHPYIGIELGLGPFGAPLDPALYLCLAVVALDVGLPHAAHVMGSNAFAAL